MERNNGQTIFLSVIGIATLLVAIIGATFAYFTTTMQAGEGNNPNATITTATVGSVGFVTTSPSSDTTVLPGWSGTGTTKVYFTSASEKPVEYSCKVYLAGEATNENDLLEHIEVQGVAGDDAQNTENPVALTAEGVEIAHGTIPAVTQDVVTGTLNDTEAGKGPIREVTYRVIFKEMGVAQNEDQGKLIKTTVSCELATGGNGTMYSADPTYNGLPVPSPTPNNGEGE